MSGGFDNYLQQKRGFPFSWRTIRRNTGKKSICIPAEGR
jgi:hypothetical protein